jgi:putative ABC transport system permease protein
MFSELRFALRALRRSPGFCAVAILTLALGIGANTAMFTVFNGVLLKDLPYRGAQRLVAIEEIFPRFARFGPSLPVSAWHYREWRRENHSFEDLALVGGIGFTLAVNGEPRRINAGRVSSAFFPILGIRAALGRTFAEDEDRAGNDHVVVLSDRLWASAFQRDPAIVGKRILLDGAPYQVVGVLPSDVRVPTQANLQTMQFNDAPADLWKPFAIVESDLAPLAEFNYGCLARLKPGVSTAQAVADLNVIQNHIVAAIQENVELRSKVAELREQMTGRSRSSLTLLLAAASVVLLIVVVNLANLLLARAAGRRRELAIRAAIGAPWSRLVRQTLTESLLLAAIGGALGTLLAQWALRAMVAKAPLNVPGIRDVRMDYAALFFAAAVSIASGVLFGVLPAWRLARTDPQEALKSGGRAMTEGRGSLRRVLIGVEVGLSAICLVVGGLLLGSFVRLLHVDKGFQADHAMVVGLALAPAGYPAPAGRVQFVRTLVDRVEALPGVVAAGVSNRGPLSGEGSNLTIQPEGSEASDAAHRPVVDYRCVTPDFFRAVGIPLIGGRLIAESDREHPVSVVSAAAARRLWPDQNPIGKRFRLGSNDWIEIVGVVGDVRSTLSKNPNMTVYLPFWQRDRFVFALHVRTVMEPLAVASAVRAEIRRLDAGLVVPRFVTLDQIVDASVAQRRFQLTLVAVFACAALLLAAIGVYGVVAQSVVQRTNEIGIRLALGASRADVWRLVGRHGLTPVAGGLAAGLAGAVLAARLVSGFLFGVKALDPLTFTAVAAVLLLSAVAACCVPAVRATRVDPLVALRYE